MIEGLTPQLLGAAALLVLLLATPLTLLASALILFRYRRAVARAMAMSVGQRPAVAAGVVALRPPGAAGDAGAEAAETGMRRMILRVAVAGLAFAAVLTAATLLTGPMYRSGLRFLIVLWTYVWPTVLALLLVGPAGAGWRIGVVAAYAAAWCLGTLGLLVAPAPTAAFVDDPMAVLHATITPPAVLGGWISVNGLPTLLWLLVLNRWLRAAGPLVLAFTTLLVSVLVGGWLALATPAGLRAAEWAGQTLGLGAWTLLGMLALTLLVVGCVFGWTLLGWLRRGYLRRSLNDRTIARDAVWLLFAAWYGVLFAFAGLAWSVAGLVAFAVAKLIGALALRWPATRPQPPAIGRSLCCLRVFSLGRRSEQMFDALARHWRHIGSLQLISGPDLAQGTLQPHQLLDFVSGRLSEHFVADEAMLAARLAARDHGPDRDGLFSVDNYFCHADTWQPVLRRLVAEGDRVLMDLRSFRADHAGCRFELEHLVHALPLQRWLLVVDDSTDTGFMQSCLQQAWQSMPAGSPNRASQVSAVAVHRLGAGRRGMRGLLHRLADDGGGRPP
jgi:hypothetical protein